jgi:uncharacterized membrane protein
MLALVFIMELFIILSVLFLLGIFIVKKTYDYEFLGIIICVCSGVYLLIHLLLWSISSYEYNKFVTERKAFVETLEYARKNESQFELASITREVSEWNKQLAALKYDNNVFFLKDYIDDRVMSLEPIR